MAATFALGAMLALPAKAGMYVPDPTKPGGIQVSPVIDTVAPSGTNNATVTFHGLQAPYMVQTSPDGTNWQNAGVTALQYPAYSGACLATNVPAGFAQFRLMMLGANSWVGKYQPGMLAVSNVFVGQAKCVGCHTDKINDWSGTVHASALSALTSIGMGSNPSCLPCHTVGFGQPGGFVDATTTPQLANVQCENCHGSANAHINVSGMQYHPVKTLAAETCGSCHSGTVHPTFEEWQSSPHAVTVPDVVYGASAGTAIYTNDLTVTLANGSTTVWHGYAVTPTGATNALSGIVNSTDDNAGNGRQMTCGFCHSGPARIAMLSDWEARQHGTTNFLALADKWDAAQFAQTCAVCHDPHSAANAAQLRNPMNSTNYYTMFTGVQTTVTNMSVDLFGKTNYTFSYMNGGFASQYDPNIHVCAQCHNSRGARWDGRSKSWNAASNTMVLGTSQSFSRGPHHSPQYNILIGIVQDDYLNVNAQGVATNFYASHSGLQTRTPYNTNQCVTCHVVSYATGPHTNVTGHSFALDTKGCALNGCHTSGTPDIEGYRVQTTNNIANTVALLNQWATNYGPNLFGANYPKYQQNAWEYNTIGALATVTNAGPTGADALKVPDLIKQARFNLYMVLNDGSLGVHNPGYTRFLIKNAETNVLSQFKIAQFSVTATVPNYYPNTTVTFTNLNPTVTACTWDFGDGTPTANGLLSQTHVYAAPGQYTVTLTATSPTGTETITRPNYVNVVAKAVPSFTYTVSPAGTNAPATVTFQNTSQNADYYRWTFDLGHTNAAGITSGWFSNDPTPAPTTYANPGTYLIRLTAYDLVGNTSTTNTLIVVP
jgi:PKD repeat protein